MRIENNDGIEMLECNAEEAATLIEAYEKLGCTTDDIGGGITLVIQNGGVIARLRIAIKQ